MPQPVVPSTINKSLSRPISQPRSSNPLAQLMSEDDSIGYSDVGEQIAAAYLPYIRIDSEMAAGVVLRTGTIVGKDVNGQLVPANGYPDGIPEYTGAPTVYTSRDYETEMAPANFKPDLTTLLSTDLVTLSDGRLILEGTSLGSNAGALDAYDNAAEGANEGYKYAGVGTLSRPIGILFDTAYDGYLKYKNHTMAPDDQHTIFLRHIYMIGEFAENRIDYAQRLANHLYDIENVIFDGNESSITAAPYTARPSWVPALASAPTPFADSATIRPGDRVACDDRGRFVQWPGTQLPYSGSAPYSLPSACLHALVGRCVQRRAAVAQGIGTVTTAPGMRVAGGSRPDTANAGYEPVAEGATARLIIRVSAV